DEATQRARRHFQNGIKLFRENDYSGALAEFEAAYRAKPGAPSLQNIALCLKELHRYPAAAAALDTLLKRHAGELTDNERRAVNDALAELDSLTATLLVSVNPTGAVASLDGRALTATEQKLGVRVSVGEHTLSAEAPGYQRASQMVRVASGEKRPVDLRLRAVAGFISLETADPDAAIALDGKPLAFERWRGPVQNGEHYVQVYKADHVPFEQRLRVVNGRTEHIRVPPLERADEPEPSPAEAPSANPQRGWYALGTLAGMGMLDAPQSFDEQSAEQVSGTMVGARGGYRLYNPIAIELLIEAGKNSVKNACSVDAGTPSEATSEPRASEDCNQSGEKKIDYDLISARIGPNLRIMSTGPSLRFISTLGAGAVFHKLDVTRTVDQTREIKNLKGGSGGDPYFLVELGGQMNFGHLLLEAAASFYIEGMANLGDSQVKYDPAVLKMIGLGVRGGYSQWRSPKR
ncbi:MAG TPA: PEGA domain-containing protein, partial [Polyangiaceae bacterium]|nr:PEGA domain-containing protein [Polyangiaceae bacterium]